MSEKLNDPILWYALTDMEQCKCIATLVMGWERRHEVRTTQSSTRGCRRTDIYYWHVPEDQVPRLHNYIDTGEWDLDCDAWNPMLDPRAWTAVINRIRTLVVYPKIEMDVRKSGYWFVNIWGDGKDELSDVILPVNAYSKQIGEAVCIAVLRVLGYEVISEMPVDTDA